MGHLLISKIYGYCIYALAVFTKRKTQSNTFVFDLGFDWRKEWDSLRDIIFLHLFSLDSSYTSLIFIISLSLSRARKFISIVKMKSGYSRFPQAGVLRLDFRYRSNANDGNKLPRYYISTSFRQNKRVGFAPRHYFSSLVTARLLLYFSHFYYFFVAITPGLQTTVSSVVWSACFCCCLLYRLQADFQPVRIPFC